MDRWRNRVALVTGAAGGMGAGICRELVKHGMIVVGCDLSLNTLEELGEQESMKLAPGKFHPIQCDLTKEPEILSMFEEIKSMYGRLDVCINNAGYTPDTRLLSGKTSDWRGVLEVNVLALCICSREAIKMMRENNIDDGQIIQICSIGGHRMADVPEFHTFHFYCGTKFMVRALTDGLRREVRAAKTRIRVGSISPGVTNTEFLEKTFKLNPEQARMFLESADLLNPKDIAEAVVYILQSPPHVEVNDILVQALEFAI